MSLNQIAGSTKASYAGTNDYNAVIRTIPSHSRMLCRSTRLIALWRKQAFCPLSSLAFCKTSNQLQGESQSLLLYRLSDQSISRKSRILLCQSTGDLPRAICCSRVSDTAWHSWQMPSIPPGYKQGKSSHELDINLRLAFPAGLQYSRVGQQQQNLLLASVKCILGCSRGGYRNEGCICAALLDRTARNSRLQQMRKMMTM